MAHVLLRFMDNMITTSVVITLSPLIYSTVLELIQISSSCRQQACSSCNCI